MPDSIIRRPPPLTRFVRRGFARLAYETSGEGAVTVLLLHDLLGDRTTMHQLRDALVPAGFQVLAPDARGHGASAAVSGLRSSIAELVLDLLAILEAEDVTDVRVVGTGFGAAVGLDLSLVAPDRVDRLVFIDPYLPGVLWDDADPDVRAAAAEARSETAKIADLATKGGIDRALDLYFTPRRGPDWRTALPKPRLAAIRRHANAFGPLLHAVNDYRPAATLPEGASHPTLILLHEDMPALDRLAADRLRAQFTGSRLEAIDEPGAMASTIVRFLAGDGERGRRVGGPGP